MSENKEYSVYLHRFPNNKVYIGITCKIPAYRWGVNGKGYNRQPLMWKAIQKYGWENVAHEVLFTHLTKEQAEEKERELISKYNSNNSNYGYNIESGGYTSFAKISDADRTRIFTLWKYNGLSITDIEKETGHCSTTISEIIRNNGVSKEEIEERRRLYIRKASTIYDEEKILELFAKGMTNSQIQKQLGCSGTCVTDVLNKNNIPLKERNLRGRAKKVAQYSLKGELIKIWECAADAKEFLTGNRKGGHIVDVCNGRRDSTLGYRWKYFD